MAVEDPPLLGQRDRRGAAAMMIDPRHERDPRDERTENPRGENRDRYINRLSSAGSIPDIPGHILCRIAEPLRVQQTFLMPEQPRQQKREARRNAGERIRGQLVDLGNFDGVQMCWRAPYRR